MQPASSMDQIFIEKLTRVIEQNLEKEDFGVEQLARELGMSRITLHRKVKAIVKKSVSEFIREIRLKYAHRLLEQKTGTVSEVAYKVGFTSVPYFSRCFRRFYNYTPGEVLKGLHAQKKEPSSVSEKPFLTKTIFLLLASVVILGVAAIVIFPTKHFSHNHHTIAVFPVESDNAETDSTNDFSWLTMYIIDKINKISELSVVDHATISTYPRTGKSPHEMAKELKVSYLVFPRVIQSGNAINVFIETVDIKSGNSWSKTFDENLESLSLEEIPKLQEEIALNMVEEMEIQISPDELEKIKQLPTQNKVAWEKYNQAMNLLTSQKEGIPQALKAEPLLEEAIRLDSTFTDAYSQMGRIYILLYYTADPYIAAKRLDQAKNWLERALKLDSSNYSALLGIKAYYHITNQPEKVKAIDKRLPKNIENYAYYEDMVSHYILSEEPYQKLLSFYKYLEMKPEDIETPASILRSIYETYMCMGFPKLAKKYANKFFELQKGSQMPYYNYHYIMIEEFNGNYDKVNELSSFALNQSIEDSDCPICERIFYLFTTARSFMRNREFDTACTYLDILENYDGSNQLELFSGTRRYYNPFGYSYLMIGQEEKANYYFNRLLKKYEDEIKLHHWFTRLYWTHLELAMVHSAMENTDKALEYLYEIRDKTACPLFFSLELKNNPWFDNLRQTEQFEPLLKEFETKHQNEHSRISELVCKYEKQQVEV